ncbi:MAG: insulinase family protein [Prevotella sp.]|nr:insulinase family protein [Prevotella sp.]
MKTILTLCFLALGLSAQAKDYDYETVAGDLTKTRIYTLDNGLRVYLSVNKEKPRIQTYIAVRTGSKNDPAETTGLAHYLEHLMFKGTRQFGTNNPEAEAPLLDEIEQRYEAYRKLTDPEARRQAYHEIDSVSQLAARYFIPNEYDKLMAAIGAQGSNAFTSNDVTCYTEDIPSNEIENWAKIQADRFQHMVIRGFHTELEAVYEEYNLYLSDDGDKVWQAIGKKLTPTHPYGTQTTIGTQEHLKNPSITNIKNYFHKWYVPNNVAICMAGDFDPDQTIAIIDRYFGAWKPSAVENGVAQAVPQPEFPQQRPLTAPTDTTVIGQQAEEVYVGWLAKKASELQCDTLEVIEEMLSNGKAGLFDLNLNQDMKVQAAQAGVQGQQDYSAFLLIGQPKPGQSLAEVKDLMLGQLDNLKTGRFSDDLLPSVINNRKLRNQRALDNNRWRVRQHLEAFVNGEQWQQFVGKQDRISRMTKQQVVDFARRYFTDGYAVVYKQQGTDTLQKKIDKPAITPIPTNRDQVSQFVQDIQNAKVEPIQPQFVDFQRDLTVSHVKKGLPLLYKHNEDDGLFTLSFHYDFGHEDDNRYDVAADYLDYVGTDRMTAAEVKQQFYRLACNYSVNVGSDVLTVSLSGLSENMSEALHLLEDVLHHAKGDADTWRQYVDMTLKVRQERKLDQRTCFDYLYHYAVYGPHNMRRDDMTADQLRQTDPQQLLALLSGLSGLQHTILYYGPLSEQALAAVIAREHPTARQLQPVPEGQPFAEQQTPQQNEVFIAPYDAKNIYLRMYHNEGRQWLPDEVGVQTVFNEYYGGGMNGIVFQELREARGLAYNAYAYYYRPQRQHQAEYYFTHIISQNDKMMDCIRQFHSILDDMPQSEAAFQIAKEAVTKQLASLRTTKFGVISAYLSARRLGLDRSLGQMAYEQLPAVTLQDIVRFEQQQMARKPYRYILLGNEQELDMESLQQIGSVRRLTTEEIFGY